MNMSSRIVLNDLLPHWRGAAAFFIALIVSLVFLCGASMADDRTSPATSPDRKQNAGQKPARTRVSFSMKREADDGPFKVTWLYPRRLAKAFEAQGSEVDRMKFGISEMQRQATAGDRLSVFELGYLYLYGIGLPRDLKEAEKRLPLGLEIGRPEGAWHLAWALSHGDENEIDLPKAGGLIGAALRHGCKQAIPTANDVARHLIRTRRPENWPRAREILDAVLSLDPANEYALVRGADLRFRQKDLEGAWAMAKRALSLPGLSADNRVMVRALRLMIAQQADKVSELEPEDIREPFAHVVKKVPKPVMIVGMAFVGAVLLGLSALLAFLTRDFGATGPGLILTACWIGGAAVIFGLGLLSQVSAPLVGLVMLTAAVVALSPELRVRYFPLGPRPSWRACLRVALMVAGSLVAIFGFMFAYEWAFKAVLGRPLDMQLVAALLRANSIPGFIALFFAGAICVPIVEEIVYRGFLLDWLRRRFSWAWAIVIGAVAFGLIHGPAAALPAAIIGLIAGWFRMRFGSLWQAVLLHVVNNGIAITLLWLGAA